MAAAALLAATTGRGDVVAARALSVAVGLAALLAAYAFCARRLDRATGALAALILAASAFFLSFARTACTEGDAFAAAALAGLIWAADRMRERPSLRRTAVAALALGLCVSAKFVLVVLTPAVWLACFAARAAQRAPGAGAPLVPLAPRAAAGAAAALTALVAVAGAGVLAPTAAPFPVRLAQYAIAALGWLAVLGWLARRGGVGAPGAPGAALVTGLAALTFFVVPPEHLGNPQIVRSVLWLGARESAPAGFWREAAALHALAIGLKSGPLLGLWLLAAPAAALLPGPARPALGWLVAVALLYGAALLALPVAQTFYTVPLLPVLAILAAHLGVRLHRRLGRPALALAAAVAAATGLELARAWPDYNLSAHPWVGTRLVAGRPSIGYRSVVHTPSDGVEQALRWLEANARPGEAVLHFALERHILRAVAPRPVYALESFREPRRAEYDYVLTHINTDIPQTWWGQRPVPQVYRPPYDRAWLEARYEKAFRVERAFGIEMATVWRRKE